MTTIVIYFAEIAVDFKEQFSSPNLFKFSFLVSEKLEITLHNSSDILFGLHVNMQYTSVFNYKTKQSKF